MRLRTILMLMLTLLGFALRLHYLLTTHPFFDEYTTVLAARQVLQYGWPRLPSGLFYEHGLLFTYLITPFTALFIDMPITQWQPAHWGLRLARWPSLLLGTVTIPLIFVIGRRCFTPDNSKTTSQPAQTSTRHALPVQPGADRNIENPKSKIQNPKSPGRPVRAGKIQNLKSAPSLLAAGLFALSPEGMVWGGRARMYALATLLVLLAVYWAYRGALYPAPARYRWGALLALLATLLSQFGALMLVPPLLVGMGVVGWLSYKEAKRRRDEEATKWGGDEVGRRRSGEATKWGGGAESKQVDNRARFTLSSPRSTFHALRSPLQAGRAWFLRPAILLEGLALLAMIGLAIFVKRLGQPLGVAALGSSPPGDGWLVDLFNTTIAYQTTFHFTWAETAQFLARQFGVPHHFWLTLATLAGGIIGLISWLAGRKKVPFTFDLYLWLVFGLIILQMVTLLEPFRRNPRYIVMYLPLFYLIAANAIFNLRLVPKLASPLIRHISSLGAFRSALRRLPASRFPLPAPRFPLLASRSSLPSLRSPLLAPPSLVPTLIAVALLVLFGVIGFNDLRIALLTPEPAYEEAFARIQAGWQPGDILLTMNTPAAGLYLRRVDGFTVQVDAEQFLLNNTTAPVDRWWGAPWLGHAADFNAILNTGRRTWFVIDAVRQPVYFRGDWLALLNSQMEQVWAKDNALIYRTRPDRTPLPSRPDKLTQATLGEAIQLIGYTLEMPAGRTQGSAATASLSNLETDEARLKLILFWRPLTVLSTDYTTFLHLRNSAGTTVAQYDSQPLDGIYPTSQWQPGETVIDPIILPLPGDLPAGTYTLVTGLYQLDTLERLPVANDTSGEDAILLEEISLP